MNWTTVYVKGNAGFSEVVLNRLGDSWVLGSVDGNDGLLMFWLSDINQLRDFKRSIGFRVIMKYRIKFFTDLEKHLQSKKSLISKEFSFAEKKMIRAMVTWENSHLGKISLALPLAS